MTDLFKEIPKNFLIKWQNIADLLAKVISVPAALIMKTDNEYMEVFISSNSDNNPYHPGDKEHWHGLYCKTVIKSQKELIVPNALKDENWDKNPDIKLGMIAYLGIPINLPDKKPFGTICVLDFKENDFNNEHKALLYQFKNVIELDLALIQNLDWEKSNEDFDIIHKLKEQNEEYLAANEELIQSNNQLHIEKEKVYTSEKHFRLLLENSPIAIFIQTEGKFSYVNKAAIDLYGANSETQLINSFVLDRIHPDYRNVVKQRIKALNEKKIPVKNIAYKHLTINNTAVDVEVSAVPFNFFGKDGALVFVHDVSERKKLTQEIIDKEQNLNNIFINSPVGIFVIDVNKNGDYFINSINPIHENMLGVKNEQVNGKPLKVLSELFNTEIYEYVKKLYDKIVDSKESLSFEEATKVKNKLVQSKTTIKPLLDENGGVYRLIGTNVDISELKEYENKLIEAKNNAEKSEEKFRKAVLTNPDSITINRLEDGVYVSVNQGFYKTFEYSENEIIGASSIEMSIWQNPEQRNNYRNQIEKNGKIENFEAKFITKTGKVLDCLVSSSKIMFEGKMHTINITKDISYLKKIEYDLTFAKEKAELNEDKFQKLFNTVEDAIFIYDPNTYEIIEANQATSKIYGYQDEELIGMSCHKFSVEVDDSKALNTTPKEKESNTVNQRRHKRKDGKEIFVQLTTYKILVNNKTLMFAVSRDITDKLLADEKIRKKDIEFRKLSANVPDLIFQFTRRPDGSYYVPIASEGIKNIFGCSPKDVKDDFTPIAKVLYPADTERVIQDIEYSAKHLTYFTCEFRVQIPGKDIQWIYSRSSPEKLPDGSVTWYGFNMDITALKQAEEKIKIANEKLKQSDRVFNLSLDMFCIAGFDGYFKYLNPAWEKTLGWSIEELLSKPWIEFVHPDDIEKTENVKAIIVDGKEIYKFENRYICKDGSEKWLSWSSQPFPAESIMVGAVRDISVSKKIENELKQAKVKAEESNRLKTEFLHNMSHEVRTPMNGIIGFSEMLDKPNLTDEKRKYFSKIVQNSSHQLLRIIDDILAISSLETKQEKVNEAQFSLNDLLMELFSVFSLKSNNRNIHIYVKKALHDEQSRITTDKTKLTKILSNLLENALKFTSEGFIEFGYIIKKPNMILYVKDTGIGISPINHKIIFERFSQEEKEISRNYGGLGLGLSISKEHAELLGGSITLESEKGKGSTFYVTIPYKPVQIACDNSKQDFNVTQKADKKYTILVAEDEEVNYLYLEVLFEDEIEGDYNLVHAKNGKEAVEMCTSDNKIDFVLMDIKMPIMNGHEATEKIKEKFPNLPIIAQTAYSTEEDKQLALKHGCDDFISKPIDKEKLFEILTKFLNDK